MDDKIYSNTANAKVASHIHGRVRLKLHPNNRSPEAMESLYHRLTSLEGIQNVRLNQKCGSVVVHYDKDRHSMAGILGFLEDLDIVVESVGHLPSVDLDSGPDNAYGQTPEFIAAIDDLNARIKQTTGLPVNLKHVIPLTFLTAGIWSIGKSGLMVEKVPGWLFLWLAFDIFVKMHSGHNIPASSEYPQNEEV
ncbi:HMA2 domain-containing protein [Methylomonas sp. MgM2]